MLTASKVHSRSLARQSAYYKFCYCTHQPAQVLFSGTVTEGNPMKFPGSGVRFVKRREDSADIGTNTASSCDGPACFVSELVAGSASISFT